MLNITLKIPAFEKLLDYVASGMGAVAGPLLSNWRARNEGRARLTAARFDADVRRIESESRSESLGIIAEAQAKARRVIDSSVDSGRGIAKITRDDIIQSIEFQGRKRFANVASVVEEAAEELRDKEVSNHEPDHDWTARFFDCVQDVSSEDMQKLWARILAGEVESPGRTSLRTLDTLRNMTKRDAEVFKDICSLVIDDSFVFFDKLAQNRDPFVLKRLLQIQECRLINIQPDLMISYTWNGKTLLILSYCRSSILIERGKNASNNLEIPQMPLTAAGRELCQLIPNTFQLDYLRGISTFLKQENCSLSYIEDIEFGPDGLTRYAKRMPIEPKST